MYKVMTGSNPKMLKSVEFGYLTAILHLAPHTESGTNLCPKASIGCSNACLYKQGMGKFENVQKARLERTKLYLENPIEFQSKLYWDIEKLKRLAEKQGLTPAVRLNGTSDIPKLAFKVAKDFPEIQFWDYTKILATLKRSDIPKNYHLTFSRSESNAIEAFEALQLGYSVATVFDKLPTRYHGYEVINGDIHDLRFLDKPNVIVGLLAKGTAKKDESGFVVRGY